MREVRALVIACLAAWAVPARAQECACPDGYSCEAGECAPICFGGCREGLVCVAPRVCGPRPWAPMVAEAQPSAPPTMPEPPARREAEPDAANGAHPVRYVDRPITLRMGTLTPTIGFGLGIPTGPGNVGATTHLTLQYGILNYLEIGVAPARVSWLPELDYGYPGASLSFRFFPSSVFELGFRTEIYVPYDDGNTLQTFAFPLRFHIAHVARIDVGPRFTLAYDGLVDSALMSVPLALAFNLGPYFFVSVEAALGAFTDDVGSGSIGTTIALGGTIPQRDRRPLVDLELGVHPFSIQLASSGFEPSGPAIDTSAVGIHLLATFYVHFFPVELDGKAA